tara:strand:- start:1104 stop:1814 length:711 start_codon:yes stop_codon:yes gene_type:complete
MSSLVVTKDAVNRLVKDIKDISDPTISKEGIYYKHDESNILLGYALIIGPKDTPYAYGNFLFKFKFPCDYPYSPPILSYLTNDGRTRFNPNLYVNGKVCLSILNTWRGEQWTSCQSIKSVLFTLLSILNNKPLLNEPGIGEKHRDILPYNTILRYKTIEIAINKILFKQIVTEVTELFWDEIVENFLKNFDNLKKEVNNSEEKKIETTVYNLQIKTDYVKILSDLNKNKNKLSQKM